MILTGRYKVGEKLPAERKLAVSLGINRATLREAIKNLEHMGLVKSRQGDGTRVLDFIQTASLELLGHLIPLTNAYKSNIINDILEFRQLFGREIAYLAAQRADQNALDRLQAIVDKNAETAEEALLQDLDLYFELARASRNILFTLLLNPIRSTVRKFSSFFTDFNPSKEEVKAHHRALWEALSKGDAEAAYQASDQHLCRGRNHLLSKLHSSADVMESITAH